MEPQFTIHTSLSITDPAPQQQLASVCGGPMQPPDWSRDRLKRIPYKDHTHKDGRTYPSILMPGNRYWVVKSHFEDIWNLFWGSVHLLNADRKHTAKALCGDPAWEARPPGQRQALGRCMKYFAVHGVLPITLANPRKSGSRKYTLNMDLSPAEVAR